MKITRLTKIYIAYAVDRDNSSESSKRGDSSRCVSSSGKQKLRKTIVFSKCSCLITRYTKSFSLLFPKSGRYFSFIQGARAKFLRATSVSISRPVTEIFHRWLTFHPPRIEGERYWSVWIFFFSFLFLHCCLSIWGYIYIYIPAFPIFLFLDLCSLSRVDFFFPTFSPTSPDDVARPWEFKGDTIPIPIWM